MEAFLLSALPRSSTHERPLQTTAEMDWQVVGPRGCAGRSTLQTTRPSHPARVVRSAITCPGKKKRRPRTENPPSGTLQVALRTGPRGPGPCNLAEQRSPKNRPRGKVSPTRKRVGSQVRYPRPSRPDSKKHRCGSQGCGVWGPHYNGADARVV